MTTTQDDALLGVQRRAQIEKALAQYPNLSREKLDEVIRWFKKEASAHDVGIVASNEAIFANYRQFRADHIDGLRPRDWMIGLGVSALAGLAICLIVLFAV